MRARSATRLRLSALKMCGVVSVKGPPSHLTESRANALAELGSVSSTGGAAGGSRKARSCPLRRQHLPAGGSG
ncbi:MAG TPA: hypothetical protein VF621_10315 [Pyrinomonadaceae bacterium]